VPRGEAHPSAPVVHAASLSPAPSAVEARIADTLKENLQLSSDLARLREAHERFKVEREAEAAQLVREKQDLERR
jgi:hypothetical protein